jgi:hypothetical protein
MEYDEARTARMKPVLDRIPLDQDAVRRVPRQPPPATLRAGS